MLRHFFIALFLVVLSALPASRIFAADQQDACPITRPANPPFVPPSPYWSDAGPEGFWYGTDSLWTNVEFQGTWSMRDNVLEGHGYRTKLVYWRRGFDWRKEPEPQLRVHARRLDSNAPQIKAEHANAVFVGSSAPSAMMTGIDIPTAGCWKITAHYHGDTLSFVVLVKP